MGTEEGVIVITLNDWKSKNRKKYQFHNLDFTVYLQKTFPKLLDKPIILVYNRGGWAGIDNKVINNI